MFKQKDWDIRINPELYAPFMTGDITFSKNQVSLNRSFNYGGLISLQFESEKWFFLVDYADLVLDADFQMPVSDRKGSFSGRYSLIGFFANYRVLKWLKAGLGGRVVIVNNDLYFDDQQLKDSQWATVAPLIVLNFEFFRNERWSVTMGSDVGGFGYNEVWTYYFHPKAGYRISNLLEIGLGIRYFSMSFQAEDLNIKTDLELYGFNLSLIFHL